MGSLGYCDKKSKCKRIKANGPLSKIIIKCIFNTYTKRVVEFFKDVSITVLDQSYIIVRSLIFKSKNNPKFTFENLCEKKVS